MKALWSRRAQARYGLEARQEITPAALRGLAAAINERRRSAEPGATVSAAQLSGLLSLQRLLEEVLAAGGEEEPPLLEGLLERLDETLGRRTVDEVLRRFESEFTAGQDEPAPKAAATGTGVERLLLLRALLVLWLLNRNPSLAELRELFDDRDLGEGYERLSGSLDELLAQPGDIRAAATQLLATIEETVSEETVSGRALGIEDQLRAHLQRVELPAPVRQHVLGTLDLFAEEAPRPPPGPGPVVLAPPGPAPATSLTPPAPEPAWMREMVLIAKHTEVWLDQLQRAYERPIERLDQVPSEELARLAELGVRGLWLIGIWERSPASQRIKRLCGDSEAGSSAYSVFAYDIAAKLGGDEAAADLQERAAEHGIRLAVDVVPNHFGIDSRWVRDYPERFLAAPACPFPGYRFEGPDLSSHPSVGIYLEDHYYDRSDAAVVFKRVDRRSGEVRFIYHGNDGTSTPWNDTAQLDYLQPAVRAAMIEEIVGIARRFPILRFDAAMTLTRMHFQRLWFPAPGRGGAIPSRSDQGMSPERFSRQMPHELWRQVVDRVAAEAPDTLLLAEAFWLLEPYFVRELGMHRVYNSAFMHLLREHETGKFQELLSQTLGADPELLRRYVNFMSNPDERSAAAQFGRGDRYFGVCTLLATLPGMPMLGHGQIEGLEERYGMEFSRAHSGEVEDAAMVARHRREIAPLLADRRFFADARSFRLLTLVADDGSDWEHVVAFANRLRNPPEEGGRTADCRLVVFNHGSASVHGWLRAPRAETDGGPDEGLLEILGVVPGSGGFLVWREQLGGQAYLRPLAQIERAGVELRLEPYEAMVLFDLGRVDDAHGDLRQAYLGAGLGPADGLDELLPKSPATSTEAS